MLKFQCIQGVFSVKKGFVYIYQKVWPTIWPEVHLVNISGLNKRINVQRDLIIISQNGYKNF